MKFTGRRLEFCLACGGRLPDGSRIDRKYCRAACIERAYYQRHPDKKRIPGSRRLATATREAGAGSNRSPDAPSQRVQHRDQAHNGLRRPPTAGPDRTAAHEMAPRAAGSPNKPDDSHALAQTSAQQEIAQLKQQLQAAADRESRLQQELAALRVQPRRDTRAQAAARDTTRRPHETNREQARPAVRGKPEAQPPRSSAPTPHPPTTAIAPPSPPSDSPTPRAGHLPRPPLLWERSSSQAGAPPVPKWLKWTPAQLEQIQRDSQAALAGIPAQMRKAGAKADAERMRIAIGGAANKPLWQTLSTAMLLRIGCTELLDRETAPQQETLAMAALEDTIEALTQQGYPRAAELRYELAVNRQEIFRLALELVRACRDWVPNAG